jgi:hypothetical protein
LFYGKFASQNGRAIRTLASSTSVLSSRPVGPGAIWRLCGLALGAGWVVFALLGRDSRVFLVVMMVLSMVLFGAVGAVFRRRDAS